MRAVLAWAAGPGRCSARSCTRPPTAWPARGTFADTSRQGRWHNARYRALATGLGLDVAQVPSLGWSQTTVPDATAAAYRGEIRRLEAAITAFRHGEPRGRGGRASSNNGVPARCACGRRTRVAESVLALGPITCALCGTDFEAASTNSA